MDSTFHFTFPKRSPLKIMCGLKGAKNMCGLKGWWKTISIFLFAPAPLMYLLMVLTNGQILKHSFIFHNILSDYDHSSSLLIYDFCNIWSSEGHSVWNEIRRAEAVVYALGESWWCLFWFLRTNVFMDWHHHIYKKNSYRNITLLAIFDHRLS